jgi:hypothetical protein
MSKLSNSSKSDKNVIKKRKNKTTIYDLNNDCIQQIIKKLSINEIFVLEKVDKRFRYLAHEVLNKQTVISFGKDGNQWNFKHSAINSEINLRESDINSDKFKAILKKFPNIKCLQISEILINKSIIEWISNNCKQLVCIHLFEPKSYSKSPQIDFKKIGKLLSYRIEIEIEFQFCHMKEESIIALMQNMPQIKHIRGLNNFSIRIIRQIEPNFGHKLKSLSFGYCNDLKIEDLKALKINTKLFELSLEYNKNDRQEIFDFISDNFIQLKNFSFNSNESISLSKLINLINLENFELNLDYNTFSVSSMDKNYCFSKLLSLKLLRISMTPTLFKSLVQMCPNIENLSISHYSIICKDQNVDQNLNHRCSQCKDNIFETISKLNSLKLLEIIDSECFLTEAIGSHINEQTFKQLEELQIKRDHYSEKAQKSIEKQRFFALIQSLTQLCDRNIKQLFTLKINDDFIEFISEKKSINGIEYNVFFDCKKFEKNYGKKFKISKNLQIIRL